MLRADICMITNLIIPVFVGNPAIGQSFVKGEHMIVSFRGTVFSGGLRIDLEFGDQPGEILGVPGKVNTGFSSQAVGLAADVEAELDQHLEVTRLTLSGHSLGAAFGKVCLDRCVYMLCLLCVLTVDSHFSLTQ